MDRSATVTVHIPYVLRAHCDGATEFSVSACDVRGVLAEIEQRNPALYRCICDETGNVRRHVNLFVNTLHIRDCNGLDTPLTPGDNITILPAVSGG